MAGMLVRHKLADFDKWYPVYAAHAETRKASGSKGAHLYRNSENPNEAFLLFEWDSVENAKAFASSEELQTTMHNAGVLEKPDVYFLDDVEHTSA
jgi:heme-degrading monooxygenase HmoA